MAGEEKLQDGCLPAAFGIIVGSLVTFSVLGLLLDSSIQDYHKIRAEAIEKGYAEHNPKTGVWEWKENRAKETPTGN